MYGPGPVLPTGAPPHGAHPVGPNQPWAAPYRQYGWGRGASATVGVGRDDLVSGEAVALDLPAASLGLRVVSGLIDVLVATVLLALLIWLSFRLAFGVDGALFQACMTMSFVISWAVVPAAWETATRGKTVGHYALGIRTVRDDAGPIRFRHAITRAMIGVVEIYTFFGVPALICAAINRKGKRIGDLVAGTYVIRDRFSMALPEPAAMPPMLHDWAAIADIGSLPDRAGVSIRQFLIRRESLDPKERMRIGQQLTFAIAPYVAPAPPAGASYEDILAAVMAERRGRDAVRLAREDALRERLLR